MYWLIFLLSLIPAIYFAENTGQSIFWFILFGPLLVFWFFRFICENDYLEFFLQLCGYGLLIYLAYSYFPQGKEGILYWMFLVLLIIAKTILNIIDKIYKAILDLQDLTINKDTANDDLRIDDYPS